MAFLIVVGVCLLIACIAAPLLKRQRESETSPSEDLLRDTDVGGATQDLPFEERPDWPAPQWPFLQPGGDTDGDVPWNLHTGIHR